MKLKSTISESEKNRILGLHNNYKNILNEESGHEEAMHYGSDEGHDDKELDALKSHMDSLEDDMNYDHIHDDYDMEEGMMGMMCEKCGGVHEGTCGGVDKDKEIYESFFGNLHESPYCAGGCPDGHTCTWTGCEPNNSMRDNFNGRKSEVIGVDSNIKNQRKEMGEMKVPEGWTMKSPEELEEEAMMGDVYEVWSGQEDRDALIREMNMTKETVYELPARFGKKRLTESQLINMINTITK